MKPKLSALQKSISITAHSKGKDQWMRAACPVCGTTEEADVLAGEGAARTAAKGKIIQHLHRSHGSEIEDDLTVK